jgi:hypothetical protein
VKQIHYIGFISIKRVEVEDGKNDSGTYAGVSLQNLGTSQGRKVGEVGVVTVRATSMEKLREKIRDHVLIIEDDIAIPLDDIGKKVTRD